MRFTLTPFQRETLFALEAGKRIRVGPNGTFLLEGQTKAMKCSTVWTLKRLGTIDNAYELTPTGRAAIVEARAAMTAHEHKKAEVVAGIADALIEARSDVVRICTELAPYLDLRSQPGERWPSLLVRSMLTKYRTCVSDSKVPTWYEDALRAAYLKGIDDWSDRAVHPEELNKHWTTVVLPHFRKVLHD
jgi:hypothetical protein